MAKVSLRHIYKVYDGKVKAVSDFNLEIEDKEFIVFVGPSGCGKSTTLRMVAGLEEISAGELWIGDMLCNHVEPKNRNISMVFQNYALFPNMTVYNNIAFGLRMHKVPKDEIDKKVRAAAETLGITEYLNRKPKALSGGQRQRVALGRAIVREPNVFLFDEPLSNLDAKLRAKMRTEITRLHKSLQTTFIYVTHDQVEAMTMGDRIVVMKGGFVQQIDTPQNLFRYPENKFVAGFIGTPQMNFFRARLTRGEDGGVTAAADGFTLVIPPEHTYNIDDAYTDGCKDVFLGIRPDDIKPTGGDSADACIKANVSIVEELGTQTIIHADTADDAVFKEDSETAFCSVTVENVGIKAGDEACFSVNTAKIHIFDAQTEITVKHRVPTVTADCEVKNGKIKMLGGTAPLPPALVGLLPDGKYRATVAPDSVRIADGGGFAGVIESADDLGKSTYVYRVRMGDTRVFVRDGAVRSVGDKVSAQLLFDRIAFSNDGGVAAEALADVVRIDGKYIIEKVGKEKKRFIDAHSVKMETPFEFDKKMYACGRSIFKKALRFEIDADAVTFVTDGVPVEVAEILDYGKKFASVRLGDKTFVLPVRTEVPTGEAFISFDFDKMRVFDAELDMRLF